VLRRYKTKVEETETHGLVDLSLFVTNKPSGAPKNIFSLHDRGQAELIEQMGRHTQVPETLLQNLAKDLRKKAEFRANRTLFPRRLVVSAEPGKTLRFEDTVRISALRCTLTVDEDVHFKSFDAVKTRYATADVGKLKLEQEIEVGVEGKAPGVSAKASASRRRTEEASFQQRYVVLNAMLGAPNELIVLQESAPGIDLTGNVFVDVLLQIPDAVSVDVMTLGAMRDEDGEWKAADEIALTRRKVRFPRKAIEVRGGMTCEYVLREAFRNGNTFDEGDDHVIFTQGTASLDADVPFIPAGETQATIWFLRDSANKDKQLQYKQLIRDARKQFASRGDAAAYTQQLLAKGANPCGEIKDQGDPLLLCDENESGPQRCYNATPAMIRRLAPVRRPAWAVTTATGEKVLRQRTEDYLEPVAAENPEPALGFLKSLQEQAILEGKGGESLDLEGDSVVVADEPLPPGEAGKLELAKTTVWVLANQSSSLYRWKEDVPEDLHFASPAGASNLRKWLREKGDHPAGPVRFANGVLMFGECPLKSNQIGLLEVSHTTVNRKRE